MSATALRTATRLACALSFASFLAAFSGGCSRLKEPAPIESAPAAASATPAAAPPATPGATPGATTRFAVIGDFGANTLDEGDVASLVKSWKPDFVVTTGDNNYPRGEAATIDENIGRYYASFIGDYKGAFGPGSAQNRFWPSPGNHDWETPDLAPYVSYFTLPGNERYYDVDLGLVHLYAVDSDPREPDGTDADSVQARWLHEKLGHSKACYDIVYFHHAPYSSSVHGSTMNMRWPFAAWGAEVVLSGHDHSYERLNEDGIPYFVDGLGGAARYTIGAAVPGSQFRYVETNGAMLVIATKTGITYEFWNAAGVKIDSLTVPKKC